ncbi:MAG: hypothetical protein V2A79_12175 [Planctomycetota bacterium]
MNPCSIFVVVSITIWLGLVSPTSAQAPEEVTLDAVRTRTTIQPDEPAIDAWITYRLKKLREDLQVSPSEADDALLQAYRTQYNHPENSASFKTRFLEQTSQRFAAEFEKGQGLEAAVGLALAQVLADLKELGAIPGLAAGLKATGQPGVRYTCAKTFAALIPTIQADKERTKTTIQLLREVGAREANGVVLARIYEALFYKDANLEPAVEAILEVIKGQLRMREQGSPAADGAEEVALKFLRDEANNLQAKNRLVAVLAAYLRLDVERYLTQGISADEQYHIEVTTDATENLLLRSAAPSPAPNLREAMKKAENRDVTLPLELNKWIGTPQTKGVLNNPPWNVAVGAPIPE